MFQPVSSKVDFPALEERILRFWKERGIFEKSVAQRQGATPFILYEGPPTANGSPGIHHVLARVFKDVMPRYKAMKGYWAPRRAGWDTHGLPVELEVEKELGFTSKAQIEEYGVEKFNARCRHSVFKYLKEWESLTERIGFWVDMANPYVTLKNEYIETGWWIIKTLWDRRLIYRGFRVTPHCPRCSTSLSSHEVALGYRDDAQDPSVYIKFRLDPNMPRVNELLGNSNRFSIKPAFFLAWTTTPWTLPGNTALAVSSQAEYSLLEGDKDYLILASILVSKIGLKGYQVNATMSGADMTAGGTGGLRYEALYNPDNYGVDRYRFRMIYDPMTGPSYAGLEKQRPAAHRLTPIRTYPVIAEDFVSLEEGTGIVHIAPAFGEVDYEAGEDNDLDFVNPVDLQGKIIGNYPFSGKFVKDADPLIIEDLKSRNLLYRSETIVHTYPFCWRCDSPLLYYAKPSWYIKTTAVKDKMIENNQQINWVPEHIREGRFGDWLRHNVDWALSRERYWGTPLPIWRCQSCGHEDCIGSRDELKKKPVLEGWREDLDLHRPYIDQVTYSCGKCGGIMRRVPEVLDCWFDSGAMPFAQWHYPFENKELVETQWFPADYICEAVDQTRGWFYTLHALSTLVKSQPCFRNVICLGLILDAQGEKMSKARGNVVDPWRVIKERGADAIRWYMLTASPPGNVRRFDTGQVTEVWRQFLLTLWNTYSFFVTYALIDKYNPAATPPPRERPELDRWILSELHALVHQVTQEMDSYNPTGAGRAMAEFVDNLSNWYVRRSRRRFWKSENDADKLAAHSTLYECLVTLAKLLAPFTPFVAEEMYQNLVCPVYPNASESVHLADYPVADLSQVDVELSQATRLAVLVSSLGRAARAKAGIKVRQPLGRVAVKVNSPKEREGLEKLAPQVLEELNVKSLAFIQDEAELGDPSAYLIAREGNWLVAVNRELTPELKAEGLAREIVHRLQTMRRSASFDIADYIITYYRGEDSLEKIMRHPDLAAYIRQETLSRELRPGIPPDAYTEKHRLEGQELTLAVKKL